MMEIPTPVYANSYKVQLESELCMEINVMQLSALEDRCVGLNINL